VTKETAPAASVERLARELYERDPDDPFARELVAWLAGSAPFRGSPRPTDKIRKKPPHRRGRRPLLDVRAELGAAHLLLADRRIELAYEAYGSATPGPTSP
jgi:hypothetical protein